MASIVRKGRIIKPRCVGVVGPFHSGKTVLLTSLISQIRYQTAGKLDTFGTDVTLTELRSTHDVTASLPTRTGLPRFDFPKAADKLSNGGWPTKTVEASEYRSFIVRSDARWKMYDLSMIDWPGERLADLAMISYGDYGKWSDAILFTLDMEQFRSIAQDYLNSLARMGPDDSVTTEQELSMEYRRVLARFIDLSLPFVTPSSFLVDLDNRYATEQLGTFTPTWSNEELERLAIGISPSEPIFPLPEVWRLENPELSARIAGRFDTYVNRVVKPVANALRMCDHILLLVDVAHLLESGPRGVEGATKLFEELLALVGPGTTALGRGLDWMSRIVAGDRYRLGGVRRLSVIGTQTDRIHYDDRQMAECLLQQLVEPIVRKYKAQKRLDIHYGLAAGVNATRSEPIGPDGVRRMTFESGGSSFEAIASAVPSSWPASWKAGDFAFPRPQPRLPMRRMQPPEHINMGKVLEWILR